MSGIMTGQLSADESLVRDWLCERGYPEPEYEPAIVGAARRPDFFAVARDTTVTPVSLWAEVKTLRRENSSIILEKAWPILKELGVPPGINGHAMLHVTEVTRPDSVRSLVKLFHQKATDNTSDEARLIFIQQLPERKDLRFVRVEEHVIEKVWARGTAGGKIAVPVGTIEGAGALVTEERNGNSQPQPAFRVFDWQLPFNCALVVEVDPNGALLNSIGAMAEGSSTVTGRSINALEEANSQLRGAYKTKAAPGVVFLIPAEEFADDHGIAAAAYGKLTVPVHAATAKFGEAFYGRDGVFRPNKNTHISVAIRLRGSGDATYFPNPFARAPIDEGASLLRGLRRAQVNFK